jgi:hypothetical protein
LLQMSLVDVFHFPFPKVLGTVIAKVAAGIVFCKADVRVLLPVLRCFEIKERWRGFGNGEVVADQVFSVEGVVEMSGHLV